MRRALRASWWVWLWLLPGVAPALDWQTNGPHRFAPVLVPPGGRPGFTLLAPSSTGIQFTNSLPQSRHLTNQVLLNGSGVAAGDVDGDGWCDLYFCALDHPNVLYRNLGNWRFQDVTREAGVACAGLTSSGAALVDLDGDGDLDLLVNTVGQGTHVFFNDGRGHFTEVGILNEGRAGMSLACGDLDGDGYLDVYVTNYRTQALMDMPNTVFNFAEVDGRRVISQVNGRPVSDPDLIHRYRLNARGGIEEDGEPDVLYHNDGGTGFTLIPFDGGAFLDEDGHPLALPPFDWGLSVLIRDLNQDGLPDIWVCNDFDTPDRVWLNQGQGRFRAAPRLSFRKSSHFSMSLDVADLNRDGFDDIFVADMLSHDHLTRMDMMGDRNLPVPQVGVFDNRPDYMMNTLFLNRGDGTYAEIAQAAGVSASGWSWAAVFVDVDLDGYEDLLICNGHERASRSLDVSERLKALRTERKLSVQEMFENRKLFPRQNTPNLAFRNRGDLTFEEISRAWGFDLDGVSHGMALADLDNDGDQDVILNNLNGPASIYRNNSSSPRLAVCLRGNGGNTRGIGARIRVLGGAVPVQSQEMICGGRYLSSDDPMRVFAAGSNDREMNIEVTWRSGRRTLVTAARANRIYEIHEPGPGASPPDPLAEPPRKDPKQTPAQALPFFTDLSTLLNHRHQDEPFDDFATQPSLPIKLSQLGPGIAWTDLNDDGWEDLVIGSGKGGRLAVFQNDGRGGFKSMAGGPFDQPAACDQTTILPWRNAVGDPTLLVGLANHEDGQTNRPLVQALAWKRSTVLDILPASTFSPGPLALADVDGDGQLDLFVGGRLTPGRYPEPASSLLFRGTGERFVLDSENSSKLQAVGLVSGAIFSDLDGDGDPDLVLACDWGPLRIFRNERGRLEPWDWALAMLATNGSASAKRLSELTGGWNAVAAGDFDGDGRLDLVAAGWGMNTRYQAHLNEPAELVYGEFNGDGRIQLVETVFDSDLRKRVPERQLDFLARGMPFLRERYSSNRAFGLASIDEILSTKMSLAHRLSGRDFRSYLFLNRGDHFLARPLPMEAQLAPAFGVCIGDLDGDGHEDLVLAQNFFATQPETPRLDGGRSLWLRGDGHGNFQPVPGQESGLLVYGEQRGAALADFDHDGRVDVVISQNGAQTKLYRNAAARPGLRVRLSGPPGNRDAIGAMLRVQTTERMGPARELHGGSGYWSCDAPVQVLASAERPTGIVVRWPGGKSTTHPIPAGATEIIADISGATKRVDAHP
ncbi:MAG TPA: VCBS repeat-containing protein [Verrucomicrobiae bacterium]|nr:VCBS repeat-containing protein [Verrucomicrobiae bacterium]